MRDSIRFQVMAFLALVLAVSSAQAQESYKFVRQWGSHGTDPEQFGYPAGLALDRRGHLYVADYENNRIQRFRLDGSFVSMWGTSGSTAGKFDGPDGVAIDTSGNVYVTDSRNFRVQKFAANGQLILTWGLEGIDPGFFEHPAGIAADTIGNIFVADHEDPVVQSSAGLDPLRNRVEKFTNTGGFIQEWGGSGTGPGQLNGPRGVAVDRSGNVYVCDSENSRIQKFTRTGGYVTQWGNYGTGPGEFNGPSGIAVSRTGDVFVSDYNNNRIQKFTSTGTFITEWGTTGTGAGEFSGPGGIAVDDSGYVYVADGDNYRIQVFGPSPHVLLVHGICGSASNWATFADVLGDSGYIVHTIQYGDPEEYNDAPDTYVPQLTVTLDSIGADHIAVVAHSMGGLIVREYMRVQATLGRPNRVAQLLSLGVPHHGADLPPRLLEFGYYLDLVCAGALAAPCALSEKLEATFHCQGNPRSVRALVAMTPGSPFLNRLNYGANVGDFDAPGSRGWSVHQSETALVPHTYYASIAGTRSLCPLAGFVNLIPVFWGKGSENHANDGVVATESALLTHAETFRALDAEIPIGAPLTHASFAPFLCGPPYTSSDTLARTVATILRTTPLAPPVPGALVALHSNPVDIAASAEDSLSFAPALSDTIAPGVMDLPTIVIPATTLLVVTMVSDDAHLTLRAPNGTIITPNDTSTVNGIAHFGTPGSGFEGFTIAHPLAGSWTCRVDAAASAALQRYACLVSFASSTEAKLWTRTPTIYLGDSLRVRARVTQAGAPRTDISWTCRVMGPDGATPSLNLHDDGVHGDSLSADGIYGNVVAPSSGIGLYRIAAVATIPGGTPVTAGTTCELRYFDDLFVAPQGLWFSPNVFNAGDSVTVYANVRNASSRTAFGVKVEVRDRSTGALLGTSTVDIAANGTTTIGVFWKVAAPDTHSIQLTILPSAFESEVNYTNNVAERTVILGTPVNVGDNGKAGKGLWFAPPRPNPANGLVTFAFHLPVRGPARLEVFDIVGRRVCRWMWRDLAAGGHVVEWSGKSADGVPVEPGMLLCRLKAAGQETSRKLVFRR